MAGVLVGDPLLDPAEATLEVERRDKLVDVAHPGGELVGALGPDRVVLEDLAVLLERRAAAGSVDHVVVGAGPLEGGDVVPRQLAGRVALARVHVQRAAALLGLGDDDLAAVAGQNPDRGLVGRREELLAEISARAASTSRP